MKINTALCRFSIAACFAAMLSLNGAYAQTTTTTTITPATALPPQAPQQQITQTTRPSSLPERIVPVDLGNNQKQDSEDKKTDESEDEALKLRSADEEEYVIERAEPVSYNEIRELMIYESNISNGECPCPYSYDRIGSQCGNESRYYKPKSKKIYCFLEDISRREVYFYWLNRGFPPDWPNTLE